MNTVIVYNFFRLISHLGHSLFIENVKLKIYLKNQHNGIKALKNSTTLSQPLLEDFGGKFLCDRLKFIKNINMTLRLWYLISVKKNGKRTDVQFKLLISVKSNAKYTIDLQIFDYCQAPETWQ